MKWSITDRIKAIKAVTGLTIYEKGLELVFSKKVDMELVATKLLFYFIHGGGEEIKSKISEEDRETNKIFLSFPEGIRHKDDWQIKIAFINSGKKVSRSFNKEKIKLLKDSKNGA